MFTTNQHQAVSGHPTILFVASVALGLVTATLFGASNDPKPANQPALLPPDTAKVASPMDNNQAQTFAADAWQAIELQNDEKWTDATYVWENASAPCEAEIWRHVGIGVTNLYAGNLNLANEQLSVALELNRQNPVAHYFMGLVRMEQAALANEYNDSALPNTVTRLVSHVPDRQSPSYEGSKARSSLELEAINEFETAVTYSSSLNVNASLNDIPWVVQVPYPMNEPLASPTVGDLLSSLGADNFVGKAHGLLADLYLDHGAPNQAEYHIDEAISLGVAVPYGYRTAGELYEEQGKSTDAFRAYMKAMKQGDGIVAPGTKALHSLGNAFEELF